MTAVSLVIPTLGRSTEMLPLLESLSAMRGGSLEVIVVDQNDDDRLGPVLRSRSWPFRLVHLRTPGERGISRARNRGWPCAEADVIAFPDDDCWYPPWLIERALSVMLARGADVVAGRAGDADGRPINGRYRKEAQPISRGNVFETQIEWVVFFRRRVLDHVGGFSEDIGIGASSPWQACEGQDIMLRAIAAGFEAYFDPAIYGHHAELDIYTPDAAMRRKGRIYGRGMGAVLRRHRFGVLTMTHRLARSGAGCVLGLLQMNGPRARYYANVTLGRLEGCLGKVFD